MIVICSCVPPLFSSSSEESPLANISRYALRGNKNVWRHIMATREVAITTRNWNFNAQINEGTMVLFEWSIEFRFERPKDGIWNIKTNSQQNRIWTVHCHKQMSSYSKHYHRTVRIFGAQEAIDWSLKQSDIRRSQEQGWRANFTSTKNIATRISV